MSLLKAGQVWRLKCPFATHTNFASSDVQAVVYVKHVDEESKNCHADIYFVGKDKDGKARQQKYTARCLRTTKAGMDNDCYYRGLFPQDDDDVYWFIDCTDDDHLVMKDFSAEEYLLALELMDRNLFARAPLEAIQMVRKNKRKHGSSTATLDK